ncbi:hypothetical protein [Mobilicoccus caccae]|nr:hypothetical protein [Mobilicoccus caccae]
MFTALTDVILPVIVVAGVGVVLGRKLPWRSTPSARWACTASPLRWRSTA